MKPFSAYFLRPVLGLLAVMFAAPLAWGASAPQIRFDHVHTYAEVVTYLNEVVEAYPGITKLHTIGKSYLGKDLLVLELTSKASGDGLGKPGYWIDGNLHSSEVAGGEIALHTIKTLTGGYGKDPKITAVLDNKVFYIMPKLNPDGSDHVITRPDNLRSVVRPFDDDADGVLDEDPGEDLNGDGYITMMRVRDSNGSLRTSPQDKRLMVSITEGDDPSDWQGEWTVYTEGVDNDEDGQFNEDGVGGIDINRNFPENWQPHPVSYQPGPYPLSEAESRAVVDFQRRLPNLTGLINYHMSGNVAVFPPSNQRADPLSGDKVRAPYEDERTYQRLGGKIAELVKDEVEVNVFKIHGASPASWHGSIWGTYVDWAYFQNGIFSWIFEFGVYPQTTAALPARPSELEQIRISDKMGGQLFVDWQPYDHPQLGRVEIGGFLRKVYMPRYGTYTSIGCLPGERYDRLLEAHTKWHLYLMEQSPLVRVTETTIEPLNGRLVRLRAHIENTGLLPTYLTQQALEIDIAQPVRAHIELNNAQLISTAAELQLGHLDGGLARSGERGAWVEWLAELNEGDAAASAVITAVSEKGGTDRKTVELR